MSCIRIFKLSNTTTDNYYIAATTVEGPILKLFLNKDIRLKIGERLFNFLNSEKLVGSFYVEILKTIEIQDINDLEEFVMDEIKTQLYLDSEAEVEDALLNDRFEDGVYDFDLIQ
jgi:hypothetical protein